MGQRKRDSFFLYCLCDPGPEYHTLFAFLIFNFLQCSLYAWHLVVSVGGGGKETNEKNRNFAGLRKERRRTASPFCCVCSVSPFNKKKKKNPLKKKMKKKKKGQIPILCRWTWNGSCAVRENFFFFLFTSVFLLLEIIVRDLYT